ncbi:hypothetical protein SynBIOSE41_01367 [Synechococcus sp. BIOS-E4-1]|nr:hypothetical protein SynBIOSE41_01367 [Synechococcus sp. BIOS-E4-1]
MQNVLALLFREEIQQLRFKDLKLLIFVRIVHIQKSITSTF